MRLGIALPESGVHVAAQRVRSHVCAQTVGTVGFDAQPQVETLDVVQVLAQRELFQFLIRQEVVQTDAAPHVALVSIHGLERHRPYLLEFLSVQSPLHEVQPVLIQCADGLLPLLGLFDHVLSRVVVQIAFQFVDVKATQQRQDRSAHFHLLLSSTSPDYNEQTVA